MSDTHDPLDKLRDCLALRYPAERIVLASGVFDLLHVGHLQYLRIARQYGDRLVVHVALDGPVRDRKGPTRPIIPFTERVTLVQALDMVDHAFGDERHTMECAVALGIRDLVISAESTVEYEQKLRNGFEQLRVSYTDRVDSDSHSTTAIIRLINNRHGTNKDLTPVRYQSK